VTPADNEPRIGLDEGATDPTAAILEKAGVRSEEELLELTAKARRRDGYDRRQTKKIADLEDKLAELTETREQDSYGLTGTSDPTIRVLVHQVKALHSEIGELAKERTKSPEDEELEPFMEEALDRFSDVLSEEKYPNRMRRLEAIRVMARGIRSQQDGDNPKTRSQPKFREPYLTGTGGGPSTSRRSMAAATDEEITEKFGADLAKAKNKGEKAQVRSSYRTKYPHLFPG